MASPRSRPPEPPALGASHREHSTHRSLCVRVNRTFGMSLPALFAMRCLLQTIQAESRVDY